MKSKKQVKKGLPVLCVIHNSKNSDLRKNTVYDEPEDLSLPGKISMSYLDIGMIKINEGEYYEAISVLTNAIDVDNTNAYAYFLRGTAKKEIEDYKGSLEDCNKAVELDEFDCEYHIYRAELKSVMGDELGSIKDYLLAILYTDY